MTTLSVSCTCGWLQTDGLDSVCNSPWGVLAILDAGCACEWDKATPLDTSCACEWDKATPLDTSCACEWDKATPLDTSCACEWDKATPLDTACGIPWISAIKLDSSCGIPWITATALDIVCVADNSSTPPENIKTLFCAFPWYAARSYIVIHQSINFVRVSDSQPIRLLSCSMQIDIDSFAWSISGSVATRDDLAYIRPNSGPVETELTLNGYTWRFLIEDVSESYEFTSGGGYPFKGTSPSVELAKPYDIPVTKVYGSTQAQQIVNSELLLTGWAWDWEIMDWLIPADVFGVNNASKMEIISTIAKAVGGFVNTIGGFPDGTPYEKRLLFKYRYPVSPKDWSGETPDHTIVDGILKQSIRWEPKPGYDHIYVSGKNAGVLVHVKRSGEPWVNAAPTIIDDLTLVQNVARERGRNYLDATGHNQAINTLDLTLPDSSVGIPGVIVPGDLCSVTDLHETWRGIVVGTRIEINRPGVTQTVEIERHYV